MTQPIRVLIVDDNARSRNGLRALLGTIRLNSLAAPESSTVNKVQSEIEVVGEAANGLEAVRQAEECKPDVVLMDARMPEMNGLEATRLIKNRWPEIKIVVLTLYAAYRAEAMAAGADTFLIKGCPNKELFTAILNKYESLSLSE